MQGFGKSRFRKEEIRKNRLNVAAALKAVRSRSAVGALIVGAGFWLAVSATLLMRDEMVRFRPGQYVHRDVLARVEFESRNIERENELRQQAHDAAPRVYRRVEQPFGTLERRLLMLPEEAGSRSATQPNRSINLDREATSALKKIADRPEEYRKGVRAYIDLLRREVERGRLVVLPHDQREQDVQIPDRNTAKVQALGGTGDFAVIDLAKTYARKPSEPPSGAQRTELLNLVNPLANQNFVSALAANIAVFTVDTIAPTHELDPALTRAEQREAERLAAAPARQHIMEKAILAPRDSVVTPAMYRRLYDEQQAYVQHLRTQRFGRWLLGHLGMSGLVLVMTIALGAYMAFYQPRIVQNKVRALGLAVLLGSMLLVTQLAGLATVPLLVFGVAPTILVTMILTIVYDHRFALGAGSLHGLLVTAALDQGIGFFLIIWMGVMACAFLLDQVRTRGKLVEVGGAAAGAMMVAGAMLGALAGEPLPVIARNCFYLGASGLGVGFIVLGILPFIERTFRVATGMTLLELADASHPLLKRLSIEASGTYAHSLQVATIAEAAADAIGADSLVCRVAAYYHDVGKVSKSDYFCENQFDGQNRHINLTPSVSMLIIAGHVKDGVELARAHKLPPALVAVIEQHHGTTLVEHFYHQACQKVEAARPPQTISDVDFRYAGPKPQTAESVIVMIADVVESATRAMVSPTASRVESLVHDLVTRRLLDGQFSEADITMGELELVEKTIVKTLLSAYHSRLAYPSTAATTHGSAGPSVRSA